MFALPNTQIILYNASTKLWNRISYENNLVKCSLIINMNLFESVFKVICWILLLFSPLNASMMLFVKYLVALAILNEESISPLLFFVNSTLLLSLDSIVQLKLKTSSSTYNSCYCCGYGSFRTITKATMEMIIHPFKYDSDNNDSDSDSHPPTLSKPTLSYN